MSDEVRQSLGNQIPLSGNEFGDIRALLSRHEIKYIEMEPRLSQQHVRNDDQN